MASLVWKPLVAITSKKSAKNLTQSEAALLAAVLPNPIIYKVNKPSALVRKNKVGLWDK